VRCAAGKNRLIPTWNVHEENEADIRRNAIRFLWNVLYQKNASDPDLAVRPPKTRYWLLRRHSWATREQERRLVDSVIKLSIIALMNSWRSNVCATGMTEILKGEGPVFGVCRGKLTTLDRRAAAERSVSDQSLYHVTCSLPLVSAFRAYNQA